MDIIVWIVLGFVLGWIASIVINEDNAQGALSDIVLGIVGATIGGWILSVFGAPMIRGISLYSLFVASLGAVVLIWLGRTLRAQA